jgi:hypothetical protein
MLSLSKDQWDERGGENSGTLMMQVLSVRKFNENSLF